MPSGGKLKISTANVHLDQTYTRTLPGSRPGDYTVLAVTDTGIGMDPGTLTHIFESFFTTKDVGKGTGLGLATVYGIVKQSNGYIWVNSAPGKGASFEIYLPRHLGLPPPQEPNADAGERLVGSERILLVEDAQPLRELAKTFLEAAGFHVWSAGSGEEALEVAVRSGVNFDLLLSDVVMPGMNGRVLAEQLLSRQLEMKVLYMSGYTDSFIVGHGVLDPGTYLVHKPFSEVELLQKVREVLDSGKKPSSTANRATVLAGASSNPEN
jgi:two-component system cell cycle sensor histidine kinase/response regulator CckA